MEYRGDHDYLQRFLFTVKQSDFAGIQNQHQEDKHGNFESVVITHNLPVYAMSRNSADQIDI